MAIDGINKITSWGSTATQRVPEDAQEVIKWL